MFFHGVNKIHGDIKPANIFIKNGNQYILGDLDSSVDLEKNDDFDTISTNALIAGTLPFSAPELVDELAKTRRTYRLDIWSLGVTFFQAFEKRWPFWDYDKIRGNK